MTEREQDIDPYWTADVALGEAPIQGESSTVRLRLHVSDEPYHRRDGAELVPISQTTGSRTYVHGRPYVSEPEISLTVELSSEPNGEGTIGRVLASDWVGMRQREIGNAQAWYYPADRLLVLWECYPFEFVRQEDPRTDPALQTVWTGFERWLVERFPDAQRIVTPSWEDLYERPAWQMFLGGQGYAPFSPGAFVKELAATQPSFP